MDGYYSAVDAAKLAGITRRQLDYWVSIELIEPAITAPRGKAGTVKLFNFDNLFQLRILKAFIEAGFSTQALRRITDEDVTPGGRKALSCSSSTEGEPIKLDLNGIIAAFKSGKKERLIFFTPKDCMEIYLKPIYEELLAQLPEEAKQETPKKVKVKVRSRKAKTGQEEKRKRA